jgi:lysozyme
MDTEEELNQKLRELSNMIRQQSNSMSSINEKLDAAKTNTTQNNATINANTSAQKNNQTGKTRYHQIVEDTAQKNDKFKENIDKAYGHSIDMLVSFGGALVNSQTGLQKYGQAVESMGKGSAALGENFGLLGKATGGLLNLFGNFASSILKLNDNTIGIRDNFAKVGGVLPTNTARLGELAKEAGFALDDMKILGDKMAELSESMSSLGGTTGEGALKFMQIANVEDNVRRQFGRLGVTKDHLLELQGMYVESQRASGGIIQNETKTIAQQREGSLQYAKTLISLASLTGKSIKDIQQEVFTARLDLKEQARRYAELKKIAKLKQDGFHDEARALEKQAENRQTVTKVLSATYDAETAIKVADIIATGVITQENADVARLIPGIQNIASRLKYSDNVLSDLSELIPKIDESIRAQSDAMVHAIGADSDIAQIMGLTQSRLLNVNSRTNKTLEEIDEIITQSMAGSDEDQLAENVETVREFERDVKKLFQTFLEFIDPLRNFSSLMIGIIGTAAAALTGLAVVKLGGGLVSGLFGGLFERGASSMRPNHIVLSGMPGVGGGSDAFAGSAADPTGLGLRKADLVDKNGKPLGGAALDARLRKIAEERTPKTTSYALKQAAKSSGAILKGAAALAGAIALIGAGIAGATWVMGKAIPTFAAGMKKFNEVDGENLKGVGLGMAGLGAGIYALAAEKVISFFTSLGSLFGGKSPLENAADQLKKFAKINVDSNKVEKNGKAVLAFANAFKEMPSTTVSISGMIAGFFSGPPMPYAEFEKFDKIEVDPAKAENNSKAFIEFSKAMGSYKNYGTIGGLGTLVSAIADSVLKYYEVDPPEKRFKDFSDLKIEAEKVGNNAIAFKDFAEGMRKYKGSQGSISILSSLVGTNINLIFGANGPIEAFVQFSKDTKDIGDHAAKNARAFFNFARALGMLSKFSGTSGVVSGFFSSVRARGDASDPTLTGAGSSAETGQANGKDLPSVSSGDKWIMDMVKRHEGVVYKIYKDSLGFPTFGVGHLITRNDPEYGKPIGTPVSPARVNEVFLKDFAKHKKIAEQTPGYDKANTLGKGAMVDLAFNMGKWWPKWPKTSSALSRGDWQGASSSLRNSKWARQVGRRSDTITNMISRAGSASYNLPKAKVGGLFSGPTSGYPIELHGTELIVPVDTNSVLMKLATKPDTANTESVNQSINPTKTVNSVTKKITQKSIVDPARIESIGDFLDKIIDVIETTDDIDQKILRYS